MTSLVEATLQFRRSTFCAAGACVEVAAESSGVVVRDAKVLAADAPVLRFTKDEWDAFVAGVHAGEFSYHALLTDS